jgi:hypothetical protein
MLGSAIEEFGDLRAAEDEKKRTEQILWNGETQTRVRQVNSPSPESRVIDGTVRTEIYPLEPVRSVRLESQLPLLRYPTSRALPKLRLGPVSTHETGERRGGIPCDECP